MTGMELARLREVAEAATEGPWAWEAVSTNDNGWCLGVVWDENDQPLSGRVEDGEGDVVDQVCELMFASHFRDAEHIATFDPPTVLALLDALAEQAATIALVAAEIEDPRFPRPGMQRRRIWASRLRAALRPDPSEGGR